MPECIEHDACPIRGMCRQREYCISHKLTEDFDDMER